MDYFSIVLFLNFLSLLSCRQSGIDINRIKLMPIEESALNEKDEIDNYRRSRSNFDNRDDEDVNKNMLSQIDASKEDTPLKVYQPKEDPKMFYQSDAYLQGLQSSGKMNEISAIYPGKEVIRANEPIYHPNSVVQMRLVDNRNLRKKRSCIKCPTDRTLVAKQGVNHVMLIKPKLLACSGKRAPMNVQFLHMYGPKFGSLLESGSYSIVGRIVYKSQVQQHCKMQVHVITQVCPVPKYLQADCNQKNGEKLCNFTCRDSQQQLVGLSSLRCGTDSQWEGSTPRCKARLHCDVPLPSENSRVSCQGALNSSGLVEGSKCRVHCKSGSRKKSRISVCRHGRWSQSLACQPKNQN